MKKLFCACILLLLVSGVGWAMNEGMTPVYVYTKEVGKLPSAFVNESTVQTLQNMCDALGAIFKWDQANNRIDVYDKDDGDIILNAGQSSGGALFGTCTFLLPALGTLNEYLAKEQMDTINSNQKGHPVLVRYEFINNSLDDGMGWQEGLAYRFAVRLYYSQLKFEDNFSTRTIQFWEPYDDQGMPTGGSIASVETVSSWSIDKIFIVKAKGKSKTLNNEKEDYWYHIQGLNGWYVDTKVTGIGRTKKLDNTPIKILDNFIPQPPTYQYTRE